VAWRTQGQNDHDSGPRRQPIVVGIISHIGADDDLFASFLLPRAMSRFIRPNFHRSFSGRPPRFKIEPPRRRKPLAAEIALVLQLSVIIGAAAWLWLGSQPGDQNRNVHTEPQQVTVIDGDTILEELSSASSASIRQKLTATASSNVRWGERLRVD
jgi:hypothetical protein